MIIINKNCRLIALLILFMSFTANAALAETKKAYSFAIRGDDVFGKMVANKVARKLGVNVVSVKFADHASKLAAVESGQVDFAANVTYTTERSERFIFSAPTNIDHTYFFSDRNLDFKLVKNIAVPYGSVFGGLVKTHYPEIATVEYDSVNQALQLFENKKVDGIVDSLSQLKFMLLAGLDAHLINFQYPLKPVSIITGKEQNRELLKRIERYVHTPEMQRFIRQAAEDYQREAKTEALKHQVALSDIDFSKPLRVKVGNERPFGQYSSDGSVSGIAADIVFESCQLMEVKCDLVSHKDESWDSMYTSLVSNQIDVLAPFALTEQRYKVAHISKKIYQPEVVVIKRKGYKDNVYHSVSELVAERVGMIEGRFFEDVLRRRLPHKPINLYKSAQQQVVALLNSEVDYIVMTRSIYNQLLRDSRTILPIIEDEMLGVFYSYSVGLGFQNDQQGKALAALFNEAISLLDMDGIIKKYDYAPDWQLTFINQKLFTQNSRKLMVTIILVLMIIAYFWHKQSITDTLTQLNNRLALYRKYKNGLPKGQVLIYFDINKFKSINDEYGHRTGDLVLQAVAQRIKACWEFDSYRIGGDEFVLIGKVSELDINNCLSNIGSFNFESKGSCSLDIKVSYGCYISTGDKIPLDDCLHLADTEMYKLKVA